MSTQIRRMTSLRVQTDDLEFGFNVDQQLYYIRSGPVTQRGETWLTELQFRRLAHLLHALTRDPED